MRGADTSLGAFDASSGSFQLRAGDINVALGLRKALLVGDQGAGGSVGVGFRGVKLLLGDFALLHEGAIAIKIGLAQLCVGTAPRNVGLSYGQVGSLRL